MRVNGEEVTLEEAQTLEQYLINNGYRKERVAVEINGEIIPRNLYATTTLKRQDTIEIVHFVGGG
ncbi:sulfur carrier protein ThiS [Hathewaya proteolytica DSM 3090]|uniref:Sulfur carrier protein ThiS n=1 Tax=Hathewaya proteolytica DSM 3090 TaxID=1121331 RepID=A0A1M6K3X0_9CLOT|nr:sulfur carrier protein ThiS [Hathewaya proteolytica]SHJ53619.1 sulfur carrier protein ThiS [Hathewaya proteolytica DSM 3090]